MKLQKSSFSTEWEGPLQKVTVELETPDFANLSPAIEGDWGANYSFKLNANDPFRIKYNVADTTKSVCLNLNEIKLLAPIKLEERQEYPLYFKFKDQNTNLIFKAFFNQQGSIGKVDIYFDQNKTMSTLGAVPCIAS
jgi:hypothetical protein